MADSRAGSAAPVAKVPLERVRGEASLGPSRERYDLSGLGSALAACEAGLEAGRVGLEKLGHGRDACIVRGRRRNVPSILDRPAQRVVAISHVGFVAGLYVSSDPYAGYPVIACRVCLAWAGAWSAASFVPCDEEGSVFGIPMREVTPFGVGHRLIQRQARRPALRNQDYLH